MTSVDLTQYKGMPEEKIQAELVNLGFTEDVAARMAQLVDGPPGFYDETIEVGEHGETVSVNGVPVSA